VEDPLTQKEGGWELSLTVQKKAGAEALNGECAKERKMNRKETPKGSAETEVLKPSKCNQACEFSPADRDVLSEAISAGDTNRSLQTAWNSLLRRGIIQHFLTMGRSGLSLQSLV
jgi:hypothetical protein